MVFIHVPILKDIGFNHVQSPEQTYQDISYYMANVLRENPDVVPPVKIADKDRIVQHGFDLKQSFRHRKVV